MSSGLVLYHPVVALPTPWCGGRSYSSRGDDDGDWYWTGDWLYERTVVDARVMGAEPVKLFLGVSSSVFLESGRRSKRRRPRYCSLTLKWGNRAVPLVQFRCKTVADAKRFADAVVYSEQLRAMYKQVYALSKATCIYDTSGNPVASFFDGARSTEVYRLNNYSTYFSVGPDAHVRKIVKFYCGYSSAGVSAEELSQPGAVVFAVKPWNGAQMPERKLNG